MAHSNRTFEWSSFSSCRILPMRTISAMLRAGSRRNDCRGSDGTSNTSLL